MIFSRDVSVTVAGASGSIFSYYVQDDYGQYSRIWYEHFPPVPRMRVVEANSPLFTVANDDSFDADGEIVEWEPDLSGGQQYQFDLTSLADTLDNDYVHYPLVLTVTDNDGFEAKARVYVTVQPSPWRRDYAACHDANGRVFRLRLKPGDNTQLQLVCDYQLGNSAASRILYEFLRTSEGTSLWFDEAGCLVVSLGSTIYRSLDDGVTFVGVTTIVWGEAIKTVRTAPLSNGGMVALAWTVANQLKTKVKFGSAWQDSVLVSDDFTGPLAPSIWQEHLVGSARLVIMDASSGQSWVSLDCAASWEVV